MLATAGERRAVNNSANWTTVKYLGDGGCLEENVTYSVLTRGLTHCEAVVT